MENVQVLVNALVVSAVGGLLFATTQGLRREVRQDIGDLRVELKEEVGQLRLDMREMRTDIREIRSDLTQVALAVGVERRAHPGRSTS